MKPLIYGYKQHTSGRNWFFERSTKPLSDAPGNVRFLAHLKSSGNLEERCELRNGRAVKLYRPTDIEYAKSWVRKTGQLLNCERQTVANVLMLIESNRTIWLSFE